MAWIKIGADSNDFTFEIPPDGTSDWGQGIRTLFLNKLRDHDHSGSGRGAKLGSGSLEDNSISTNKIQAAAVTLAKMAINSVGNTQLVDGGVSTSKVANDAIDDTKILLRNNQWLTARNAANNADVNIVRVNGSDVIELAADVAPGDNTISTAKLQDGAVTAAKRAALNLVTTGFTEIASATGTLANLANITITTSGRPVFITVKNVYDTVNVNEGSLHLNGNSQVRISTNVDPTITANIIYSTRLEGTANLRLPTSVINTVASLPAGTHTIYLSAVTNLICSFQGFELVAYEL